MDQRERLERFFQEEVEHYLAEIRFADHEDKALRVATQAPNWAYSLDEFHVKSQGGIYKSFRNSDPSGKHVIGLLFARSRAMHQFAQTLAIDRSGSWLPALVPAPLWEVVWRSADELPKPDPQFFNALQEKHYRDLLEMRPIRFTWDAALDFFSRVPLVVRGGRQ